MRRACPYRGENNGPGKDIHGELDPTPGIREQPGSLAAVERSAARLGIVRSALEPDLKSTDRLWLKWARTGPMHCSANQQIIDNSFGWRIEEIV